MIRIVLRILLCLVIILNIAILILSAVTGKNIYKEYGKQICIGISIFVGVIIAFYVALAMLGIGD